MGWKRKQTSKLIEEKEEEEEDCIIEGKVSLHQTHKISNEWHQYVTIVYIYGMEHRCQTHIDSRHAQHTITNNRVTLVI